MIELKLKVENGKYGEKSEKFRIKRWIFWG
jgi:hypothetical protein